MLPVDLPLVTLSSAPGAIKLQARSNATSANKRRRCDFIFLSLIFKMSCFRHEERVCEATLRVSYIWVYTQNFHTSPKMWTIFLWTIFLWTIFETLKICTFLGCLQFFFLVPSHFFLIFFIQCFDFFLFFQVVRVSLILVPQPSVRCILLYLYFNSPHK